MYLQPQSHNIILVKGMYLSACGWSVWICCMRDYVHSSECVTVYACVCVCVCRRVGVWEKENDGEAVLFSSLTFIYGRGTSL